MTIASEIQRIQTNIANAYDVLEAKGATMPATENTDNLVTTIDTISSGGGDTITATNNTGSAITSGDKVWVNKEAYYERNFIVVGSPTINNSTGIVSGFSTSNYLQLQEPFNPGNNPWEIVFKVTTGSSLSNTPTIFGNYGASYQNSPQIFITSDTYYFHWIVPYGSGSDIFEGIGSYTVQPNTTYWLKLSFTGSQYKLDYSTDGQTFITDSTYSTSDVIKPATEGFNIGFNYYDVSSTEYWIGSIDLSETYISINGVRWWTPTFTKLSDYTIENKKIRNFDEIGNLTIDDSTGIVSGFSSSNYLITHENIEYISESIFKVQTGSSFSADDYNYIAGGPAWIVSLSTSGYLRLWSDNSSSWVNSSTQLSRNTIYWIRYIVRENNKEIQYSTDGISFTSALILNESNTPGEGKIYIGHNPYKSTSYWRGTIYIKDCYVKVNGQVVWTPYLLYVTENTLTGYAQENIASGSTGDVLTLLPPE